MAIDWGGGINWGVEIKMVESNWWNGQIGSDTVKADIRSHKLLLMKYISKKVKVSSSRTKEGWYKI